MIKVQRCICTMSIGDYDREFYGLAVVAEYDGIVKRVIDYNGGNIQILQVEQLSSIKLLGGPLAYAQSVPLYNPGLETAEKK